MSCRLPLLSATNACSVRIFSVITCQAHLNKTRVIAATADSNSRKVTSRSAGLSKCCATASLCWRRVVYSLSISPRFTFELTITTDIPFGMGAWLK